MERRTDSSFAVLALLDEMFGVRREDDLRERESVAFVPRTRPRTHLVLGRIVLERLQRRREQLMGLRVLERLVERFRARQSEVLQCAVEPLEVVVDLEALAMRVELLEVSEEGEVLARILRARSARSTAAGRGTHLLRVLSNHEDEREVVHPQCEVKERVGVAEEDDVRDGVLRSCRVPSCDNL